jgi:tartrate dehydratase beta subunit/fumarate hydratase class I family protein
LSFPFTGEKIRALKAGDEVLISGIGFTGRDAALANAQILDRLEPTATAAGFKLPRVCTPEELMGVSRYE